MQVVLQFRGVCEPDAMRRAGDFDVARVRKQRGKLLGRPVRPDIVGGSYKDTRYGKVGQFAQQFRAATKRAPTRIPLAIHVRVGVKDLAAGVFPYRLQAFVISGAPITVVHYFAARNPNDPHSLCGIPHRIGEGEIRAVTVAEHYPALIAVGDADRLNISQERGDIIAPIPSGSPATARLKADDPTRRIDQSGDRRQIVITAGTAVKAHHRRAGSGCRRPELCAVALHKSFAWCMNRCHGSTRSRC